MELDKLEEIGNELATVISTEVCSEAQDVVERSYMVGGWIDI